MKEYVAGQGGRYTYADDFENLQDLAKTCDRLFTGCDAFVLAGCVLTITDATNHVGNLTEGYVWLDGKVRYIPAATGCSLNSNNAIFVKPSNTNENVAYEDGTPKTGRTDYACTVWDSQPASGAYLKIEATGTVTVKEALFGRYSLLLDGGQQTVVGPTIFSALTTFESGMHVGTSNYGIDISSDKLRLFNTSGASQLVLGDHNISMLISGTTRLFVDANGLSVNGNITGGILTSGNFALTTSGLIERNTNDVADLWVNKYGYHGGSTQFRNFKVGNGKNSSTLIEALGASSTVSLLNGLFQAIGDVTNEVSINGLLKANGIALKIGNQYVSLDERYALISTLSNYVTNSILTTQYPTTEAMQNAISTAVNGATTSIMNNVSSTYVPSSQFNSLIQSFNDNNTEWYIDFIAPGSAEDGMGVINIGHVGVMFIHFKNISGNVSFSVGGKHPTSNYSWASFCHQGLNNQKTLHPCVVNITTAGQVTVVPQLESGLLYDFDGVFMYPI